MKSNYLLILFLLTGSLSLSAQVDKPKYRTATRAYTDCDSTFPKCFIGNWKGELEWIVTGKPVQKFTMQLTIQPADTPGHYTWQLIYGEDYKDNRPYILKPVDTAKGHWVVDEGDGIMLDSYVHGNSIHGAFTVMGNTIVDNYSIMEGRMHVEFFSVKLDERSRSGKGTTDTPFVDSYKISSYQSGVLRKLR